MSNNDMAQKIKNLRKMHDLTLEQVAKEVGVGKSTVRKWETGMIANMRRDKIGALANALHTTPAYLMGWEEPESKNSTWIPVLGKVAAGIPIDAVENIDDYEEVPQNMAKDYFALRIKGDSMEPRVKDGDVVIVKKQSYADTGDIAVVLVNGDSATVKRIKKGPDGVMLIPNNTAYEPMYYSNDDIERLPVTILGKVVELRAKI